MPVKDAFSACAILAALMQLCTSTGVAAADGGPGKTIRDVTPPSLSQVYRSGEVPSFVPKGAQLFENVRSDRNGTIHANGKSIQLYGIKLPARTMVCTAPSGARWTCGHRALMALRNLIDRRALSCAFKGETTTAAICGINNIDIAQWMLQEGWAELAEGVTNQSYINAAKLAQANKKGLWVSDPAELR